MSDSAAAAWHEAWVEAWATMPAVKKGRTAEIATKQGGSYSYSYADLGDIIDTVRPHLAQYRLAIAQSVVETPTGPGVVTVVSHRDGHAESYGPTVVPGGGDARAHGSAITYARRYSLAAALGLATEDDDDGAAAVKPQSKPPAASNTAGACPSCGASVWDNRSDHETNPKTPAFICSNRDCDAGGEKKDGGRWPWATWDATFFDSDVQGEGPGDVIDRMLRLVANHVGGDEVEAWVTAEALIYEAANELGVVWPDQNLGPDKLNALYAAALARHSPKAAPVTIGTPTDGGQDE